MLKKRRSEMSASHPPGNYGLKSNMAPIALKDKRVEELTKQLVRQFINDEVLLKALDE